MHDHITQIILLLCVVQVVASFVHLEPKNATVLRSSEVHFNCSTDESWDVMIWQINGRPVVTISAQFGPMGSNEGLSTINHSTSGLSVWELVLLSAPFAPKEQEVICEFLPTKPNRQSATLIVQETGGVKILEGDLAVQVGARVIFHCEAIGWYPDPTVSWTINGTSVDGRDYNTSSLQDPDGLFNSTSVLHLNAETSNTVYCHVSVYALQEHQTSGVKLTVVAPKKDNTVVIAVTVSVCTIILLAVLIFIIYYRNKLTKSGSKNEVSSCPASVVMNRAVAEGTRGKVNLGYHTEDVPGSGQGDLRDTSDRRIITVSTPRAPDIIVFNSQNLNEKTISNPYVTVKAVRRITTV